MTQTAPSTTLKIPVLGIGLILTITFVVLKLTGVVSWSWLVVFMPMIAVAAIFGFFLTLFILGLIFVALGAVIYAAFQDGGRTTVRRR